MAKKVIKLKGVVVMPNGRYQVRKYYNGKRYTFYLDDVPTKQADLDRIIWEHIEKEPEVSDRMTLAAACESYNKAKSNVISPSTLLTYRRYIKYLPDPLAKCPINELTQLKVQTYINQIAEDHSPKYVRCVHGYLSSVLNMFRPSIVLRTTLPQKQKKDVYIPSSEDVEKLIRRIDDDDYMVPIRLAIMGLRRSEICALDISDLDPDNTLHIRKAKVYGPDGWVIKNYGKTTESHREIIIPADVAGRIRKQGYVYKHSPQQIGRVLRKIEQELGLPDFTEHKLRHYFATFCKEELGLSDKTIMALGGWSTPNVMQSIYQHAQRKKVDEGNVKIIRFLEKAKNLKNHEVS